MSKVATVFYDGEVFRPEGPVDLAANVRYVISIAAADEPTGKPKLSTLLRELAGSIEGPEDWSSEHDHHIHGTPRRDPATPETAWDVLDRLTGSIGRSDSDQG